MAFGNDVGDSHDLEYGSHWSTSNNSSSLRSRCHHDIRSAPVTKYIVVNSSVFQRNFFHVATRFFHRFLHRRRYFLRLAFTHTNATVTVTNNRQSGEAKDATALDHLSDPIHRDHFFLQTIVWSIAL